MGYVLWIGVLVLALLAGVVLLWILRRPQVREEGNADDLTEWECPQCGFHVQMGTECIYCGAQKPGG